MSKISFKNNIKTTLAQDLNASATDIRCYQLITSEVPQERLDAWPTVIGTGANKVSFYLTLEDKETNEFEVVLVIGVIQNDVDVMHFNIVRGQDGTTPRTFDKDTTTVEHRLNAGAIDTFKQDVLLSDLVFDDVPESSVTSLLVGNDMGIPGEKGFKVHTHIHPSMVSTQSSTDGNVLTVVSGTPTWREAALSVIARDSAGNIKTSDAAKYPGMGRTASANSGPAAGTFNNATAYGYQANTTGHSTTAIGSGATAGALLSTALGYNAKSSHTNSVAIGGSSTTTAVRQVSFAPLNSDTHISTDPRRLSGVAAPEVDQDAANKEYVDASIDALPNTLVPTFLIGSIISTYAADGYVPNGCVPTDGAEYTQAQFPSFYTDYLVAGKIVTCTYTEFDAQVALTGNCGKFALDTVNQKFKVPLLKDGDSITQATSAGEIGKSYKAGLPNITGEIRNLAATTGPLSTTGVFGVKDSGIVTYATNVTKTEYSRIVIDASQGGTDAIYGNSTTVTDEQVRLRHFVVLASAQNNASMFDWSNYMAALAGKANNDLSNLEPAAEEVIRSKLTLRNLGARTTTGSWTLTDVKIGRPLWITYTPDISGAPSYFSCIVASGATVGAGVSPDSVWVLGRGAAYVASNNLLIKPTNSTIVLNILVKEGTGTLYAEQI